MARLDAKARAALPDSAFAYVDSKGKRRLPIHDESHVRNALSRFNQVKFEDDASRDRAFQRVLRAAVQYGIAPIGFVAAQVRAARGSVRPDLPSGQVTLMLTDIEGSTGLVDRLGDGYRELLEGSMRVLRSATEKHGGYEVDARADEFFGVFPSAENGLAAAITIQRTIADGDWSAPLRVRIGLHSGSPGRTDTGYIGMPVNIAARVCQVGHGGQILVSSSVGDELGPAERANLRSVGSHKLRGVPNEIELLQVVAPGLAEEFPPLRLGDPDGE